MLGTLPKLADKTFVLGFLLPTILFVVACLWLFSDFQIVSQLLKQLSQNGALQELLYLALLIWGLAILLMMLNHNQYKLLEGYLWPMSRCRWLKERQLAKFDELTNGSP